MQLSQSPTIGKIVEALSKAQIEFQPIIKDVKAHHHKYAPLDVCFNSTRKALCDNGLIVTQSDISYNGLTMIETTLGHVSGEYFKSYTDLTQLILTSKGPNPLHSWGSIKTYTRRYAYLLIIGAISEDEDNDGSYIEKNKTTNIEQNKTTKYKEVLPLTTQLINLIKASGCDATDFANFHNISSKDLMSVKNSIDNFDDLLIEFRDSKFIEDVKEDYEDDNGQ